MPTLHIFRGLPGSGKSTAARKLAEETGAILIEPDMLIVRNGQYEYTPGDYIVAQSVATQILTMVALAGADIIYADVLPMRKDINYVVSALPPDDFEKGRLYSIIIETLPITPEESKLRNRHNVRPEDIDRMAQEWEDWK